MELIAHRRNSIEELQSTQSKYGVEVDIRSYVDDLVIHHDPFCRGVLFESWLDLYQHGTLILNVKEEGLEPRLIAAMEERGIEDYFFLDQSFPFLIKYHEKASGRSAVRISEFESLETALSIKGKAKWAWIDCFTKFPLGKKSLTVLKQAGYKTCLVSPELQNRSTKEELQNFGRLLSDLNIDFDAVCTKHPKAWEALGFANG
jgi:hypothetical protein